MYESQNWKQPKAALRPAPRSRPLEFLRDPWLLYRLGGLLLLLAVLAVLVYFLS